MKIRNLLLFLITILLLFVTGCNNDNNECFHNQIKWKIVKNATCTTDGLKIEQCIRCKEIFNQEVILATDHTFSEEWSYDENSHFHKCLNCDEKIDKNEHNYQNVEIISPTCEDDGKIVSQCLCGDIESEKIVDATGHNYVAGKCKNCGDFTYNMEFNYIYFGEYPQSLKEDSVEIISKIPNEQGYYLGSDNNYYVKLEATPYDYLNSYFNNETKILNTTYYFKVEPIKWIIISMENNIYQLVSDVIIDQTIFNPYGNSYEESNIRYWLNNDFYNQAFDDSIKSYINLRFEKNNLQSTQTTTNPYLCDSLYDKVSLLSTEEAKALNSTKQLTDYAKAKGCMMSADSNTYNNGAYWLRSSSNQDSNFAQSINCDGSINLYSNVKYTDIGVVPVIAFNDNQICETHQLSDWKTDLDTTCTEDGYYHKECKVCYHIYDTQKIIGEHDLTHYEAISNDCTEPYYDAYDACSKCDFTTYQEHSDISLHHWIDNTCTICHATTLTVYTGMNYKYLYFGEYPQSVKEDDVSILTDTADSDGYYLGSDGQRYQKLVANSYTSDMHYNNGTTLISNNTYYFKVEPIKWQVLEENDGTYKLLSSLVLDNQKFYTNTSTRIIDEKTIYANNYEYSTIRSFLNNEFYNKAFNAASKQYIITSFVDNSLKSTTDNSNNYISNNTYDKVFLPSLDEMTNPDYGFRQLISYPDEKRKRYVTDYVTALGSYASTTGIKRAGRIFLRTPDSQYNYNLRGVSADGSSWKKYVSNHSSCGLSPMITININKTCTTHQLSDWIIDSDAICTQSGSKHKECIVCHDILETMNILPEHQIIHLEAKEATCTCIGWEEQDICQNCDYYTFNYSPELGSHNWIDGECTICHEKTLTVYQGMDYDYIYFGEYPQTLKKSEITISGSTDSNGYYIGSDNQKYVKMYAQPYYNNYYFNDQTTQIEMYSEYYFKVEPIKWQILEENSGTYKLFSTLVLDTNSFYPTYSLRTIDGNTIYSNNYEYSNIRYWLNNDFYNQAFNDTLKTYINTTHVDNWLTSVSTSSTEFICNDTFDKVYLMSYSEITNSLYGYTAYNIISTNRYKQVTDYAKANGCYTSTSSETYNNGHYYLRSLVSITNNRIGIASAEGYIFSSYVDGSFGIVPSITINLNNSCSNHQSSDWIIDMKNTCASDGYKHKECLLCGYILEQEILVSGHDILHVDEVIATCTNNGHEEYDMCKNCDYVTNSKEILMINHNWNDGMCLTCHRKTMVFYNDENYKYIYMGEYPQTLKDDSVNIITDTPDENGYYLGSDHNKYAKVVATPYNSQTYFNDKTLITYDETYYFKVEPVKWQVLESNNKTYKLLSTLIIDNQQFNLSNVTTTIDGNTICSNNYEYSNLRKWLNNDLYNSVFTNKEKSYIDTVLVDNSLASTTDSSNSYICENTNDKVYLPSRADMMNTSYGFSTSAQRQKQLTDYAKAKGCYMDNSNDYYNNGQYWLRSPYYNNKNFAFYVNTIGSCEYVCNVTGMQIGIAIGITITTD